MHKNFRRGYYLLLLFMFGAFFVISHKAYAATTLYASTADQGTHDCLSSGNSCKLQTALDAAFTANDDTTINIAAGTYSNNANFSFNHSGFTHSLSLHGAGNTITTIVPGILGGIPLAITTGGSVEEDSISFTQSLSSCLYISAAGSVDVHDSKFSFCDGGGLYIDHASGTGSATISNNTFSNNKLDSPDETDGGLVINITSGGSSFPVALTGNTFDLNTATNRSGGAVYINSNSASAPILLNGNTFSNNITNAGSGGAVYINTTGANSGVTIGDGDPDNENTFTNNNASASGGAVCINTQNSSSPVLLNGNIFTGNTVTNNDGGALYTATSGTNSTITLGDGGANHGNIFTSNSANTAGGAFYLDTNGSGSEVIIKNNTFGQAGSGNSVDNLGGAGKVFAGFGSTITGNTFTDNFAGANAGALALIVDGAGANTSDNLMQSNTFTNNRANTNVGGLDVNLSFKGGFTMNANKFLSNQAILGEGGGARIQQLDSGEQIIVTNNLFAENAAGGESGGFDYYGQSSFGMSFTNNTVADNTAVTKGGGANFGFNNLGADYGIHNSIFWGNTAASGNDVHIDDSLFDAITFDFNDSSDLCIQSSGCDATPAVDFFAGNNITDNPEFADEDNGDYSLTELSPAVDAGDDAAPNLPAKDITNGVTNRIQHTHVDMGAYELVIPAGDLDPYVLTETTPVASSLSAGTTSATYNFSIAGSGESEYIASDCGNGSTLLFTDAVTDPGHQAVVIQDLASGKTYTCSFHIHSIGGDSNTLTIGPFSVKSAGAVPVQFLIDMVRATAHPDGTLVLSQGTVYLIKNGQRFGFRDPAEYQSYGYNFNQIVPANDSDMHLGFEPANILKAMPGTLVIDKSDGRTVYMIGSNYTKRGFVSATVFKNLGYTFKALLSIDLTDYPSGPIIDSATNTHPEGSLVLDGKTVWWILNGVKQGFESQTVFDTYGFSFSRVVKANNSDLALPAGNLIPLRDGTLVTDSGNYYIISNGVKRQFASPTSLTTWGYKTSNAVKTSLANYSSGQMIN